MYIDATLAQLQAGGAPVCIVRDESERYQAYATIMRRLDAINPLMVRSHSPTAIMLARGGSVLIRTSQEILAEYGPISECYVTPGKYWLGSDDGYGDEYPMRQLEATGFWIMQYPVNVRWYSLAVRAGVVNPPSDVPGIPWSDQLLFPLRPAVMVTIDEATVFARWLVELTGQRWRLPTEMEWEYAARGTDQRRYPWGNDRQTWRANVADQHEADDSRPGPSLEPVGLYPDGDSPFGVSDLVGNVDEWTTSAYVSYGESVADDQADLLVVRGGSYNDALRTLTYRSPIGRNERRPTLGFRLVR